MTAAPDGVTVRDVDDADLPAIQAIYAHHVLHGLASWEETPPDLAEMTARCRALLADGFPYRVAVRDGRVVGYAYAGKYRPRPAYRKTVENSVYVAEDARGAGIGPVLLDDIVA
ncbi:MAG: GNAT family N-acetyltransferase, partial [Rhodospirillaceae bacterium]